MITIVGGGFAGVEAAWACAQRGVRVRLYEMRPVKTTPAHKTDLLSELVCSNSFKSQEADTPAGQLKAEMKALGSLVIPTGEANSVPGGSALAVDRDLYGRAVTKAIEEHQLIEVVREEFTPEMAERCLSPSPPAPFGVGRSLRGSTRPIPEGRGVSLIIATGPLTSEPLAEWLAEKAGRGSLYFYDAVSPTVEASTVNFDTVFAQSRYEKGEGDDYLNCPFDKESYLKFVEALVKADRVPLHEFEKAKYFAGCTPIEEIASKGVDSLRYGNFKPVGLTDPKTGRWPYAVVQLRPENREKTLYSLVACQNRLKWGVQKEVLQMVPGLEKAEFVRLGVIHRNTYIEAPKILTPWLEFREVPGLFVAGQLTGVEGYVESAAMGIYVGITAARGEQGKDPVPPPRACAYGSLVMHLQDDTPREFAPMNINWGLFPDPLDAPRKKDDRRLKKLEAAREAFAGWKAVL